MIQFTYEIVANSKNASYRWALRSCFRRQQNTEAV